MCHLSRINEAGKKFKNSIGIVDRCLLNTEYSYKSIGKSRI